MGADRFMTAESGATPREAFDKARNLALYEYGHRGYTGTIAEKRDFAMVEPFPGEGIEGAVYRISDGRDEEGPGDKWGPAGCILIPHNDLSPFAARVRNHRARHGQKTPPGESLFLFFGWAPS